jgi:uncharacterized protein (TIGR02413 family)
VAFSRPAIGELYLPVVFLRDFLVSYIIFLRKEQHSMTISVLFLSITIQRNIISKDEILHNEQIEKAMNDVKERQALYCDHL